MVRPEMVLARLERLDEYVAILRRLRRYPLDAFLADPERYGSAERFIQLSIECLNDIGNHVVADRGLPATEWASDIPVRLCEDGVIDETLRDLWVRMIAFRNLLVHEYVRIDRKRVHAMLQDHLDDFEQIKRAFVELLITS